MASKKVLSFYNTRQKWSLGFAFSGIAIMIVSLFIYDWFDGNWLFSVGMLISYIPLLFPFKLRDFVKVNGKIVSFKIGRNKTRHIRTDRVSEIEIFSKKMTIYEGYKKHRNINVSDYDEETIYKLIKVLKGEAIAFDNRFEIFS